MKPIKKIVLMGLIMMLSLFMALEGCLSVSLLPGTIGYQSKPIHFINSMD
ncbi:MAG: hypothetical protein HQM12_16605 [SAR324 cluster bacterium]|nr:hypothetical protein [SAR324 cluster bacterium]